MTRAASPISIKPVRESSLPRMTIKIPMPAGVKPPAPAAPRPASS